MMVAITKAIAPAREVTDRPTGRAAMAGLIAPAIFYTVMLVLGAVTPGYHWMSRFGSDLSIGSLGGIMIANFVVYGVLEIAFAVGLRRAIGPERSGRLGTALIGLAGAGFVVAGIFVTDPNGTLVTVHGAVHVAAALVVFSSLSAAGFAFARRFRYDPWFACLSILTGIATPTLFVATWFAGDVLGLVQRILLAIDLLWLTLLALRLYRRQMDASRA